MRPQQCGKSGAMAWEMPPTGHGQAQVSSVLSVAHHSTPRGPDKTGSRRQDSTSRRESGCTVVGCPLGVGAKAATSQCRPTLGSIAVGHLLVGTKRLTRGTVPLPPASTVAILGHAHQLAFTWPATCPRSGLQQTVIRPQSIRAHRTSSAGSRLDICAVRYAE